MRSIGTLPAFAPALLAALLAAPALPCSGAPPPLALERSIVTAARSSATLAAASPAAPTFQVVGSGFDLAIVNPTNLLTTATSIRADNGFGAFRTTGLAISPAGTAFIVGNDFNRSSWLAQVNFNTGAATTVGKITGYVINDIAFDGAGQLYGVTDNTVGTSPHSLLLINTATAAVSVVMMLDNHSGRNDIGEDGAIAFNPGDGSFYYADTDASDHLFVDRLAPGTFTQTPVLTDRLTIIATAMAFSQGKLWLFDADVVFSADASNIAAGLTVAGSMAYPTAIGIFGFFAAGAVPNTLSCVPGPAAACLYNRFRVEITYDATPNNGSGPANVVLESSASVKFTFFDPTNIEMILKILNACTLNDKWWVFAGGLTDVGVTIKVTDTATGAVQNYGSAKGHLFQTFADTSAFDCP